MGEYLAILLVGIDKAWVARVAEQVPLAVGDMLGERVHYLPVTHHDHPDGADTRRFLICRLKVNGYEVSKHTI